MPDRPSRTLAALVALGTIAPAGLAPAAPQSASTSTQFQVSTPGFPDPRHAVNADVLLDRIVFADGAIVEASSFVYPAEIRQFAYSGTTGNFRTVNGSDASVGLAGSHRLEACDGNAASISLNDLRLFPAKLRDSFGNRNLNNRSEIKNNTSFSMTVALATRVWDSNFELDERPELFIFEEQGNSVVRVQACTELGELVGNAVEIRAVDLRSISPSKVWVGRFGTNGLPISGSYELKVAAIDLTELGVTSVKWLRITNTLSGGNGSADLKIVAVDTSPGSGPPTMLFD